MWLSLRCSGVKQLCTLVIKACCIFFGSNIRANYVELFVAFQSEPTKLPEDGPSKLFIFLWLLFRWHCCCGCMYKLHVPCVRYFLLYIKVPFPPPPPLSPPFQVANTIFWLGRKVKDIPDYSGPLLNSDFVEFGELQPPLKVCITCSDSGLPSKHKILTQTCTCSMFGTL